MVTTSQKKIKEEIKKSGINVKELFPRSKIKGNRNYTPYQLKKIRKALNAPPPDTRTILQPDNPAHYIAAGFEGHGKYIFSASKKINIYKLYYTEGESSFYSASFFGGVAHVQLIPLNKLPEFLEYQAMIDAEEGQFYDAITLREGDRGMHGQDQGFNSMSSSAEELMLKLMEYKRHGALIGEGGTFDYIQVCFINFAKR